MAGPQPMREAEMEWRDFDNGRGVPEIEGQIVYQLAEGMQRGMHSRGYGDAYLTGQETRVRYFHEVLNDYLEGGLTVSGGPSVHPSFRYSAGTP